MIYELLKDANKEQIYDNYTRIVDNPKPYKKITTKDMIKASLDYYSNYNKLLDICTYQEIRLLHRILKKEVEYEEVVTDKNFLDLRNKFLLVCSDKELFIPEELQEIIKDAYKNMNKELEEKKEILNVILIGLFRIYGMLEFNSLYEILINYIGVDKEVLKKHLDENKCFKFYIDKVTYKKKEYYIFRTFSYFIDILYKGIESFKDIDYYLRPFEEIVYLKYNSFYDMNKDILEFIKKMNSYNRDFTNLYNEMCISALLDDDRKDVIKYLKELLGKEKDIDNILELFNNAMDNIPSAALKGYTRKEYVEKISDDSYNTRYDKIKYDNKIVKYKEVREKCDNVVNEAMYYAFKEKLTDKFHDVIKKNDIYFYEDDTHVVENLVLFHSIKDDKKAFDIFYEKKINIFFPYYDVFKEYKESYVEGLFTIISINSKEGFVTLKSTFSKREYKVYDVALSKNNNIVNYYIYTSLVTVENYTFTTNYAFIIKDYDKDKLNNRIDNFKGIDNKTTKEFLAFYELYRDNNVIVVNRKLE